MDGNRLLSSIKLSFCCQYSTQDALVSFTEVVRSHIDNIEHVLTVPLDLSNKFNSTKLYLLYNKLRSIGLDENSVETISTFRKKRLQKISQNCGVRPDLVCSAGNSSWLLLNLYKSNLCRHVNNHCNLVADDNTLTIHLVFSTKINLFTAIEKYERLLKFLAQYFFQTA